VTQALSKVKYHSSDLDTVQLGSILVKSGFFADVRDEAKAIVKVLAGSEMGFGPIASMRGVNLINGQISMSANLIGAAIQRSGKYVYRVAKLDDNGCVVKFFERGQEIGESSFTIADAQRAGLVASASGNYKKFPRNMLFARALTNGARWYCPEVFSGAIYTPDELGAAVNAEGDVLELPATEQAAELEYVRVDEESGEVAIEESDYDAALREWVAASEEATRLHITHKELPSNADVTRIKRWTEALTQLIYQASEPRSAA
jgi:hypothetical protein